MWPDPQRTQELLDAAGRDPDAADALFAEHREALRRAVAVRLDPALARRVDASDVVQDVLIEAHRRLKDYLKNPTMPFGLWLRQLAKDRMIDAHRFHRQAQRRSMDREQPAQAAPWSDASSVQLLAALIDSEKTPGSMAVQHELERKLHDALHTLDETDREIILLRHQEQMSNQDAASELGLTDAAASMRYLRALRRLRATLIGESDAER